MDNLKEWLTPQIVWFAVGFIFLLFEFINPGVILIFFGIGAWIVAIICLVMDIPINLQLTIFLISSVIFLISLRKKFKVLFEGRLDANRGGEESLSEFIGKRAIVTRPIAPKTTGKVVFRGTSWQAEANEAIAKDAPVEIVGKNNITLVVRPL